MRMGVAAVIMVVVVMSENSFATLCHIPNDSCIYTDGSWGLEAVFTLVI